MMQWLAYSIEWLVQYWTDIIGIITVILGCAIVIGMGIIMRPNGSQVTDDNRNESYEN